VKQTPKEKIVMTYQIFRALICALILLVAVIVGHQQAQAGPPLICHPYEIGNAKSLPWAGSEWRDVKKDYDINRLVNDTLALLTPDAPVIARMETLRRATIYAVWSKVDQKVGYAAKNEKVAGELLERLMSRVRETERTGKVDALALFDAGYYVESWKNSVDITVNPGAPKVDGYALVNKASGLRGTDATMEFAAALMIRDRTVQRAHLQKAVAGAPEGSLLARNIVGHFSDRGRNLAELRASLAMAKN
jgi:hypothetical protein